MAKPVYYKADEGLFKLGKDQTVTGTVDAEAAYAQILQRLAEQEKVKQEEIDMKYAIKLTDDLGASKVWCVLSARALAERASHPQRLKALLKWLHRFSTIPIDPLTGGPNASPSHEDYRLAYMQGLYQKELYLRVLAFLAAAKAQLKEQEHGSDQARDDRRHRDGGDPVQRPDGAGDSAGDRPDLRHHVAERGRGARGGEHDHLRAPDGRREGLVVPDDHPIAGVLVEAAAGTPTPGGGEGYLPPFTVMQEAMSQPLLVWSNPLATQEELKHAYEDWRADVAQLRVGIRIHQPFVGTTKGGWV